jgi:hypothetical protein
MAGEEGEELADVAHVSGACQVGDPPLMGKPRQPLTKCILQIGGGAEPIRRILDRAGQFRMQYHGQKKDPFPPCGGRLRRLSEAQAELSRSWMGGGAAIAAQCDSAKDRGAGAASLSFGRVSPPR